MPLHENRFAVDKIWFSYSAVFVWHERGASRKINFHRSHHPEFVTKFWANKVAALFANMHRIYGDLLLRFSLIWKQAQHRWIMFEAAQYIIKYFQPNLPFNVAIKTINLNKRWQQIAKVWICRQNSSTNETIELVTSNSLGGKLSFLIALQHCFYCELDYIWNFIKVCSLAEEIFSALIL